MDTNIKSFGENFISNLLARIVNQGGNPEDILNIDSFSNEIASRAALIGINSRNTDSDIFILKPTSRLSETEDIFSKNESNNYHFNWRYPEQIDRNFPIVKMENNAYCEVRKITIGTPEFMLEQITAMDRVPAEVNYLLTFAFEKEKVTKILEGQRNNIIVSVDSKNKFDDRTYNMLYIKDMQNRRNSGGPQITFFDEGELFRHYENEEVFALVRFKDLIPL